MAALVIFLAFSFTLPPIVKADDLPPVDPTAEDELLPPPVDTPVSNPSLDDWVTWPIEEPGIVRPIKEPTGSIHIKIHHKDTTDGDNDSTGYIPEVNYSQFEQPFAALAVNNRSSDAAYNSLVGCNPNIKERIAANIIIDPED